MSAVKGSKAKHPQKSLAKAATFKTIARKPNRPRRAHKAIATTIN